MTIRNAIAKKPPKSTGFGMRANAAIGPGLTASGPAGRGAFLAAVAAFAALAEAAGGSADANVATRQLHRALRSVFVDDDQCRHALVSCSQRDTPPLFTPMLRNCCSSSPDSTRATARAACGPLPGPAPPRGAARPTG